MVVGTDWSDLILTPDDWAEAFDAPPPETPHNKAREDIWAELVNILADRDDSGTSPEEIRKSLQQNKELRSALHRAWPMVAATDLVGDLWSVPAYLRKSAPGLGTDQVRRLQRSDPHAWTLSDLPLLDAARHRLGDAESSRRRQREQEAVAAGTELMDRVVKDLIARTRTSPSPFVTGARSGTEA